MRCVAVVDWELLFSTISSNENIEPSWLPKRQKVRKSLRNLSYEIKLDPTFEVWEIYHAYFTPISRLMNQISEGKLQIHFKHNWQ